MKILVIDDNETELEKAKQAVIDAGHEPIAIHAGKYPEYSRPNYCDRDIGKWITEAIKSADGVITDLHFPAKQGDEYNATPPAGLLVVIEGIIQKKHVMICTDGNHHKETGWIFDAYLRNDIKRGRFFSLQDGKDWQQAVEKLVDTLDYFKTLLATSQ